MMGSLRVLSGTLLAIGKGKLDSKGIYHDNLPDGGAQGEHKVRKTGIGGASLLALARA